MENNDSPYVYEKPLRVRGAKFTKGITALGLVAFGTVIGGGAFANSLVAEGSNESQTDPDLAVLAGNGSAQNINADSQTNSASQDSGSNAGIVSVPLQQAAPKQNSAAIQLPALADQSFGNTSSATPSAGGSQSGSSAGSYYDYEDSDDDQDERDHDDDDDDEYEDED